MSAPPSTLDIQQVRARHVSPDLAARHTHAYCAQIHARAQWLSENGDLLDAAHERLTLGRLHESLQYQIALQQNLCAPGPRFIFIHPSTNAVLHP